MISALHLLWIVPCAALWGFSVAALIAASGAASRREEAMLEQERMDRNDA